MAACVSSMPYCSSGERANMSFFVLFAGVRCTLFISACSSGGKGPAPVGATPPSPVCGDAGGASSPPLCGGREGRVVVVVDDVVVEPNGSAGAGSVVVVVDVP